MTGGQALRVRTPTPNELERMLKFGGAGAINTATDFAIYAALVAIGAPPLAANAVGFLGANVQSYLLNARFAFRDAHGPATLSFVGYGRFFALHLISLGLSTAVIAACADRLGPIGAKAAATVVTFSWNYATVSAFVFRRRAAAPGRAEALK